MPGYPSVSCFPLQVISFDSTNDHSASADRPKSKLPADVHSFLKTMNMSPILINTFFERANFSRRSDVYVAEFPAGTVLRSVNTNNNIVRQHLFNNINKASELSEAHVMTLSPARFMIGLTRQGAWQCLALSAAPAVIGIEDSVVLRYMQTIGSKYHREYGLDPIVIAETILTVNGEALPATKLNTADALSIIATVKEDALFAFAVGMASHDKKFASLASPFGRQYCLTLKSLRAEFSFSGFASDPVATSELLCKWLFEHTSIEVEPIRPRGFAQYTPAGIYTDTGNLGYIFSEVLESHSETNPITETVSLLFKLYQMSCEMENKPGSPGQADSLNEETRLDDYIVTIRNFFNRIIEDLPVVEMAIDFKQAFSSESSSENQALANHLYNFPVIIRDNIKKDIDKALSGKRLREAEEGLATLCSTAQKKYFTNLDRCLKNVPMDDEKCEQIRRIAHQSVNKFVEDSMLCIPEALMLFKEDIDNLVARVRREPSPILNPARLFATDQRLQYIQSAPVVDYGKNNNDDDGDAQSLADFASKC